MNKAERIRDLTARLDACFCDDGDHTECPSCMAARCEIKALSQVSSTSEAGPELDARIASLIGLAGGVCDGNRLLFLPEQLREFFGAHYDECGGWGPHGRHWEWAPSTDHNDAIEAAEKRGLLKGSEFFMHRDEDVWEVGMLYRTIETGKAESLPLATCRYIENFRDTNV